MYKGEAAVNFGLGLVGTAITLKHVSASVRNYDTDEYTDTITDVSVTGQIEDISNKEREFLTTQYNINAEKKVIVPKGTTVDIEDYFTLDGDTYTVLQLQEQINHIILYCKYEPRT